GSGRSRLSTRSKGANEVEIEGDIPNFPGPVCDSGCFAVSGIRMNLVEFDPDNIFFAAAPIRNFLVLNKILDGICISQLDQTDCRTFDADCWFQSFLNGTRECHVATDTSIFRCFFESTASYE